MVVLGYNSNTPRWELRVVITGELWSGIAQSVRGINCWDVIPVRGRNFLFVILLFSHSRRPIRAAFCLLWSQCTVRWNFEGNCLINSSTLPPILLSSLCIFLTFYSFIPSPCFYHFPSSMSFTLNTSCTCTSKYAATERQQNISHITD